MADAGTKDNPVVADTAKTDQVHIDAPPPAAPAETADTAQSLGVSPSQFEKFYSAEKSEYDWKSHAKEQDWIREHGGKPSDAPKDGEPAKDAPKDGEELTDDGVKDIVEGAGLDFAELDTQIANEGALTEAQMKALTDKGIPEDTIKGYVNYLTETAKAHVTAVSDHFGGDAGFADLREWAKANLTADEIAQYEKQLSDPESWRPAADQLLSRAGKPAGTRADPIVPQNAPKTPATPGQVVPYANQAEMVTDMRKPEYKNNPGFRQEVMNRARVSTWNSNPRTHTLSG
jgi:hypothetical protein